ncbi:MAG: hypothetical protein V3T86_04130 [Planctomycetota bacterium]
MGVFERKPPKVTAAALFDKWFTTIVPEGHTSLENFEALMTDEERERMPKTLSKLALDGVDRVYGVRKVDLAPDREGLEYLDKTLGPAIRHNLTRDQSPADPRNLFRLVATEFGCILGEIYVRADKGVWEPRRSPNHWRSTIRAKSGAEFDPFAAVIKQLSDEREDGALLAGFDGFA